MKILSSLESHQVSAGTIVTLMGLPFNLDMSDIPSPCDQYLIDSVEKNTKSIDMTTVEDKAALLEVFKYCTGLQIDTFYGRLQKRIKILLEDL